MARSAGQWRWTGSVPAQRLRSRLGGIHGMFSEFELKTSAIIELVHSVSLACVLASASESALGMKVIMLTAVFTDKGFIDIWK